MVVEKPTGRLVNAEPPPRRPFFHAAAPLAKPAMKKLLYPSFAFAVLTMSSLVVSAAKAPANPGPGPAPSAPGANPAGVACSAPAAVYFDGACRDSNWIKSTFNLSAGFDYAIGRNHSGGNFLIIRDTQGTVEAEDGRRTETSYVTTDKVAAAAAPAKTGNAQADRKAERKAARRAARGLRETPLAKGGYRLELLQVERVMVSKRGVYATESFSLQSKRKNKGWNVERKDWRLTAQAANGKSMVCTKSGCVFPMASSAGLSPGELCQGLINQSVNEMHQRCRQAQQNNAGDYSTYASATIGWLSSLANPFDSATTFEQAYSAACMSAATATYDTQPNKLACMQQLVIRPVSTVDFIQDFVQPITTDQGNAGDACGFTTSASFSYESNGEHCSVEVPVACTGKRDNSGTCQVEGCARDESQAQSEVCTS